MTVRTKFLIPTLILIITGLGACTFVSYLISKKSLQTTIKSQLIQITDSTTKHLSSWTKRNRMDMAAWSEQKYFATSLKDSYIGKAAKKKAGNYLARQKKLYNFYQSINAADSSGKIVASSESQEIPIKISKQNFFIENMKGNAFVTDVFSDPETRKPVFIISSPIFEKDAPVGVLFGIVDLEVFNNNYIDSIKIGKSGYGFMFDKTGSLIAHPDKASILNTNAEDMAYGKKLLAADETGLLEYIVEGKKKLISFQKDEQSGWTIAISADTDEIFLPIRHLGYFNAGITAAVLLFTSIFIFFLVEKIIVKPINMTADYIGKISSGDIPEKIVVEYKGEFEKIRNTNCENLSSMLYIAE